MKTSKLSEVPQYTIRVVNSQTGIPPVTIRAWERRYNLLSPFRSDNRYRLYSERDISILLWIKKAMNDGLSISNAVKKFHSLEDNGELDTKIINFPDLLTEYDHTPKPAQYYSSKLYDALIDHDEITANTIYQEAYSIFNFFTVCENIFIPSLIKIGTSWENGRFKIPDEHFASSYIKAKLMSLYQSITNHRGSPKIIIGCAPFEHHEIGCLMLSVILRREGFWVEYLGPDIPIDDLVDYADYTKPAMIILSATMESNAMELVSVQRKLSNLKKVPLFGYGGPIFTSKPELQTKISGVFLGNTLVEAVENINSNLQKSIRNF